MNFRLTKGFGFYTGWSFTWHGILVILILIGGYLVKQKLDQTKDINIKLIESSVRVDLVAMPRLTVKELKALGPSLNQKGEEDIEPEVQTKAPVKSENKSDLSFEKKTKKLSFMEMLKKQAAKKLKNKKTKKTKKTKKKSTGLSNKERSRLRNLVLAGNQLSSGTAAVGDEPSGDNPEFAEYLLGLRESIRPAWKLPSYLLDKELNCRIRIFLNKSGQLVRAEIFESSGEKEYDQRALEAVKSSSPFSNLPKGLVKAAIGGEIVLGFPL